MGVSRISVKGYSLHVKPSPHISGLCYSIFRLEPYTGCEYGCTYCYARWYGRESGVRAVPRIVGAFRRVALKVKNLGLTPYPFRLSTLVEPLQEAERRYKVSYRILATALSHKYPVILNTKSKLIVEEPWFQVLRELARKKLVVVQVSVSSLNPRIRLVEPRAPKPASLLEAASRVAHAGIPVVIRYQPLIPGLSDLESEVEEAALSFREVGGSHVIVEYLRVEAENMKLFEKVALEDEPYRLRWERYGRGERAPVRPPAAYRAEKLAMMRDVFRSVGLGFATCKEGYPQLDTVPDCCGFYLLAEAAIRPSLRELIRLFDEIPLKGVEDLIEGLEGYLAGGRIDPYPRVLRKPLKWHERVLISLLKRGDVTLVVPSAITGEGVVRFGWAGR